MADWELFDGEKEQGPYTEEWMLDAVRGSLKSTAMIRRVGTEEWKGLRTHAPFAMALDERARRTARPTAKGLPFQAEPDVVRTTGSFFIVGCLVLFIVFAVAAMLIQHCG